MGSDVNHRRCVAALWALVETARAGVPREMQAAAEAANVALAEAMADESYLIVHENCGAIHVDGHLISLTVDVFAGANGLAALLQGRGVGELLFEHGVTSAELLQWAVGFCRADGDSPAWALAGSRVHAGMRSRAAEAPLSLGRQKAAVTAQDSHLRAIYLENQLMALVIESVAPMAMARCVVHGVVDHLLMLPGGLEPLTVLQGNGPALRRALHVAVLTVHFGRIAGWPEARLAELGATALLHDIGAVIDPKQPAEAGFHWLLDRGLDDFWMRSALVTASWRAPEPGAVESTGGSEMLVVDLVRLGVQACERALADDSQPVPVAFGQAGTERASLLAQLRAVGMAALAGVAHS